MNRIYRSEMAKNTLFYRLHNMYRHIAQMLPECFYIHIDVCWLSIDSNRYKKCRMVFSQTHKYIENSASSLSHSFVLLSKTIWVLFPSKLNMNWPFHKGTEVWHTRSQTHARIVSHGGRKTLAANWTQLSNLNHCPIFTPLKCVQVKFAAGFLENILVTITTLCVLRINFSFANWSTLLLCLQLKKDHFFLLVEKYRLQHEASLGCFKVLQPVTSWTAHILNTTLTRGLYY